MSIVIVSPTDSPEAVAAAMGDLATNKPADDKKPSEEKPIENEIEEKEIEEIEKTEDEIKEDEDEIEKEELEAKNEAKPKKKGGFQKKIERLRSEVTAKDMELNYLRQEVQRKSVPVEAKPEVKQDLTGMPKENDFATVREYDKALIRWEVQQELLADKQKARDEETKRDLQTKFSKHGERVDEYKKTNEDFEEDWNDALKEVGAQNLSLTVREVIVNSDIGPELMQALIDDPKEFKSICSMTPLNAAKALGKIEARISKPSKTSTETKPKSKVPEPVKTVRAKGGAVTKGYRDDMTMREYEAWRKESSGKGA